MVSTGLVSDDARHAEPPLRLTRRGRVVVYGLMAVVASAASAVLFTTASRADEPTGAASVAATGPAAVIAQYATQHTAKDAAASRATVVVRPGDTLWSVAALTAPGRDRAGTVAEIRRLNHLDGDAIRPGDVLLLPN